MLAAIVAQYCCMNKKTRYEIPHLSLSVGSHQALHGFYHNKINQTVYQKGSTNFNKQGERWGRPKGLI